MHALAVKGHKELESYLTEQVEERIAKKWTYYELCEVLETLIRVEHPKLVPIYVDIMNRAAKKTHYSWEANWLMGLMPQLPAKAVAPLEALIPSINQHSQDYYVDRLDELKRNHASK